MSRAHLAFAKSQVQLRLFSKYFSIVSNYYILKYAYANRCAAPPRSARAPRKPRQCLCARSGARFRASLKNRGTAVRIDTHSPRIPLNCDSRCDSAGIFMRIHSVASADVQIGTSAAPRRSMHDVAHILLVEDDAEIRELVATFLRQNGMRVSVARDGREMDRLLSVSAVDLLVLDIMLPDEDGLSLCRRVRTAGGMPIIMLTARGQEVDRVVGLEMGADDYLCKPFSSRELLARIRAVLRRSQVAGPVRRDGRRTVFGFSHWRLDLSTRKLCSNDGLRVPLTSSEFELLVFFCEHPNRVLTRDELIDSPHERLSMSFERSIDVYVSRLRRKIEKDPRHPVLIETVRSGGYLFTPTVMRV
jgi:two-component system, OmpR family, response regulator